MVLALGTKLFIIYVFLRQPTPLCLLGLRPNYREFRKLLPLCFDGGFHTSIAFTHHTKGGYIGAPIPLHARLTIHSCCMTFFLNRTKRANSWWSVFKIRVKKSKWAKSIQLFCELFWKNEKSMIWVDFAIFDTRCTAFNKLIWLYL